jgi:hypothetical protein
MAATVYGVKYTSVLLLNECAVKSKRRKATQMNCALDETLKQLLINKVPLQTSDVHIAFEAPGREWGFEIQSKRAKEGNGHDGT